MIKNQIKTFALLLILTVLLLWFGSFFGKSGLTTAFIFVLLMNFVTYFWSDKIVLAMYRAKEVKKQNSPGLHEIVEELAKEANIPKPKIYVIPTENPNAFCTGRNPKHSAVAVTQGIVKILTKSELKGVLAHEIAHIKNRDTLIQVVVATIAGVISYLAMMARFAAIFGGGSRDNNNSGNAFGMLAIAIVAPLIALIIRMAISRSREYIADESGAKFIKDGKPLANALHKLETASKLHPLKFGSTATENLFIVNPFSGRQFINLFSTHPRTEDRIKRLNEFAF